MRKRQAGQEWRPLLSAVCEHNFFASMPPAGLPAGSCGALTSCSGNETSTKQGRPACKRQQGRRRARDRVRGYSTGRELVELVEVVGRRDVKWIFVCVPRSSEGGNVSVDHGRSRFTNSDICEHLRSSDEADSVGYKRPRALLNSRAVHHQSTGGSVEKTEERAG